MEHTVKKMKVQFNKYIDGLKEGEISFKQFQNVFNRKFDDLLEKIENEALNERVEAERRDWANSED